MFETDDEVTKTSWGLFALTGHPGYYMLYKKLLKEDKLDK